MKNLPKLPNRASSNPPPGPECQAFSARDVKRVKRGIWRGVPGSRRIVCTHELLISPSRSPVLCLTTLLPSSPPSRPTDHFILIENVTRRLYESDAGVAPELIATRRSFNIWIQRFTSGRLYQKLTWASLLIQDLVAKHTTVKELFADATSRGGGPRAYLERSLCFIFQVLEMVASVSPEVFTDWKRKSAELQIARLFQVRWTEWI